MKKLIPYKLIIITFMSLPVHALFGQVTTKISIPGEDYFDPEILSPHNIMVWMGNNRQLWYAELDPQTGGFITNDGKDIPVDISGSLLQSWNAGEFLMDANGWKIVYTKPKDDIPQLFAATLLGDTFHINQLTQGQLSSAGAIVSRNENYQSGKLLFFKGNINHDPMLVWSDIQTPNQINQLGAFQKGFSHGDFLPGKRPGLIFNSPDKDGYYQIFVADEDNNHTQLTFTPFHKQNPMAILAPEHGNEIVLGAIKELQDGDSLLFWKKNGNEWAWVNSVGIPETSAYQRFSSSEMFSFQGRSFVSLQIEDSIGDGVQNAEIWIVSIDGKTSIRVDDQSGIKKRTDPEYYVTDDKVFIYYNVRVNDYWELWASEVDEQLLSIASKAGRYLPMFNIYPNPVANLLHLENINWANGIMIYNIHGTCVYACGVENNHAELDISFLDQGIYFLRCQGNGMLKTTKFVRK